LGKIEVNRGKFGLDIITLLFEPKLLLTSIEGSRRFFTHLPYPRAVILLRSEKRKGVFRRPHTEESAMSIIRGSLC